MRRAASLLVAAVALAGAAPAPAAEPECSGPPAAFAGVIYDPARRADFQRDVDHFGSFVQALRGTYCLPPSSVRILAFEGGYQRDGTAYPEATEAAFKSTLHEMGALAHKQPDLTVFVMLSSHGLMYTRAGGVCSGVGSFAQLKAGEGEDGSLYDCELGETLAAAFPADARLAIVIDCSFCGGFSDSITAVSGTVNDDALTSPSGVPAPGRIVVTGCAVTTECFGGDDGGVLFEHLSRSLAVGNCDGYTAPGFPAVQGINVPVRVLSSSGTCGLSEWFFAAVSSAYDRRDPIAIQQQFRIKFGFDSLAHDFRVL